MLLMGDNFIKTDELIAKFTWEDKISLNSPVIFKNPCLLGTTMPDFGPELEEGDHNVSITISLNGQQFNPVPVVVLYKAVDPNMTEEELKKMDEEEAKNAAKKAPPKKK